jgi:hypothetical protein
MVYVFLNKSGSLRSFAAMRRGGLVAGQPVAAESPQGISSVRSLAEDWSG